MINLDERFHDYLGGRKTFKIDGVDEPLKGYGYNCDGNDIVGHYVTTERHRLNYDRNEQFLNKELYVEQ